MSGRFAGRGSPAGRGGPGGRSFGGGRGGGRGGGGGGRGFEEGPPAEICGKLTLNVGDIFLIFLILFFFLVNIYRNWNIHAQC